jgi:hypothetical protein
MSEKESDKLPEMSKEAAEKLFGSLFKEDDLSDVVEDERGESLVAEVVWELTDPEQIRKRRDIEIEIANSGECPMEFQGTCSLLNTGIFGEYVGAQLNAPELLPEFVEIEETIKRCKVCRDCVGEIKEMMVNDFYREDIV